MDESQLIPSLPYEIAMTCLARLPRRSRAIASCVCRAWRKSLSNDSLIDSIRLSLNLSPGFCIFIGVFDTKSYLGYVRATQNNTRWLLLDPLTLRTLALPNPLAARISIDIHLRSAAANCEIFLPEIPLAVNHKMVEFSSNHTEEDKGDECWKSIQSPPPFNGQKLRRFACAEMKRFVYVSGGLLDVTREASKSAFRYDTLKNQWETLPDMIMPRINCTGLVMDEKFFAIGGYHCIGGVAETHASGEFFDPKSGEWTLVPNLCANGLRLAEDSNVMEPQFAAVEEKLYAMQSQSNEVMEFDALKEQWTHFGYVGGNSEMRSYGVNYNLLGIGRELWAIEYIMGNSICIYVCNPGRSSKSIRWRQVKVPELEGFDHVLTCTAFRT